MFKHCELRSISDDGGYDHEAGTRREEEDRYLRASPQRQLSSRLSLAHHYQHRGSGHYSNAWKTETWVTSNSSALIRKLLFVLDFDILMVHFIHHQQFRSSHRVPTRTNGDLM